MNGNEYDDLDRIAADDALLDVFGALSWDYPPLDQPGPTPSPVPEPRSGLHPADPDPLLALLQSLRADVDSDAPLTVPVTGPDLAPVIPLRSSRMLRRSAITAAVAAAVLSVSGVAAAGFSGAGTPLYPLHKAIFGPTASQQALHRAEKFVALAHSHLDGGRLRAASEALDHAEDALGHVDLEEQGSVPAQVSALRDALNAAFAADAAALEARQNAEDKADQDKADHGKGSGKSDGEHGSGSDNQGSDGRHNGEPSDHTGDGSDSKDSSGSGHRADSKDSSESGSSSDPASSESASRGGGSHESSGD